MGYLKQIKYSEDDGSDIENEGEFVPIGPDYEDAKKESKLKSASKTKEARKNITMNKLKKHSNCAK